MSKFFKFYSNCDRPKPVLRQSNLTQAVRGKPVLIALVLVMGIKKWILDLRNNVTSLNCPIKV